MRRVISPLAYADNSDASQGNFIVLLAAVGAVILVCVLAAALIFVGRAGSQKRSDAILTVAIFWGLISLGSIVYATITQMKWSQENQLELQSGYGNPNAVAPAWPWMMWGILALVYVLLAVWAGVKKG